MCCSDKALQENSVSASTGAWIIFLAIVGSFLAGPCYTYFGLRHGQWWVPAIYTCCAIYAALFFAIATGMDPGILPKAYPWEVPAFPPNLKMAPTLDVEVKGVKVSLKYCVTCKFYRLPRTCHCSICDACILNFDHHCPWLNNCVGIRNYRVFFTFVASLSFLIVNAIVVCLIVCAWESDDIAQPIVVCSIVIGVVCLGMSFPILGLMFLHVFLMLKGQSTNEILTFKLKGQNPYGDYGCHNMARILCEPNYPSMFNESQACWTKKALRETRTELLDQVMHIKASDFDLDSDVTSSTSSTPDGQPDDKPDDQLEHPATLEYAISSSAYR